MRRNNAESGMNRVCIVMVKRLSTLSSVFIRISAGLVNENATKHRKLRSVKRTFLLGDGGRNKVA